MRDVVVIGGGLTGLSACYQLEKLGVDYTVIELKRRFGGAIHSEAERGFIMDASAFAFETLADESWLPELGLSDQLMPLNDEANFFRDGTESLISALAADLQGGRLMRMAVSSIGRYRRRFTICLENGMMYDAGALILALPARYAARTLYNLAPEAAERLADYRCQGIWQVALGVRKRETPSTLPTASSLGFSCLHSTDQPGRVSDHDHLLIQVTLPAAAGRQPADIVRQVTDRLGITSAPIVWRALATEEAVSIHDQDHPGNMRQLRALLPDGIALVGSDYLLQPPPQPGLAQLAQRLQAGRQAANDAHDFVKARESK